MVLRDRVSGIIPDAARGDKVTIIRRFKRFSRENWPKRRIWGLRLAICTPPRLVI